MKNQKPNVRDIFNAFIEIENTIKIAVAEQKQKPFVSLKGKGFGYTFTQN